MTRITVGGPELEGFTVAEPAASVRLLFPDVPGASLVLPVWNGNEFLRADGTRPTIRTFTPRRVDSDAREVDIEVVMHGAGPAAEWAQAAEPGATAALSGPGRGYTIDPGASAFLLVGDESALPAISQLLEALPPGAPTHVIVEVVGAGARLPLGEPPITTVEWHEVAADAPPGDAMVDAVRSAELLDGVQVWAAGEAAAVQKIRRYLFDERAMPRTQTTIRGYWKRGRAGVDGRSD
jgi:NADPH-dependent ferric siderophore reductase